MRTMTVVCIALLHKIGRNEYWKIISLTSEILRRFAYEFTIVKGNFDEKLAYISKEYGCVYTYLIWSWRASYNLNQF